MIVSDVGRTTARSASSCEKTPRALDSLARAIPEILEAEQAELLRQATEPSRGLTRTVRTIEEAAEQARDGAARLPWS